MQLTRLESAIEAILFVSGNPVEIVDIANALEIDTSTVKDLVENLKNKYLSEKRGMDIVIIEDKVQMCTSNEYSQYIQKIVGYSQKKRELTPPMLETLAIIAYKQPVTKADIQNIRGVNSDHVITKLIEYDLIEEKGRRDTVGRPSIFGTTDAFLTHFGCESISSLPKLSPDHVNENDERSEKQKS